jgi:hypothetical protein
MVSFMPGAELEDTDDRIGIRITRLAGTKVDQVVETLTRQAADAGNGQSFARHVWLTV